MELSGRRFPGSWGASKKEAEQQAALNALLELDFATRDERGHVEVRSIEALCAEN